MSRSAVEVRAASASDATWIAGVARTTWTDTYASIMPETVQHRLLETWYSVPALTRVLDAPGAFLVAERMGVVVGFAQFVRRNSETVELTRIYVLPEHQHDGIGTELLEAGLAACRPLGVTSLRVFVERDNARGRGFYLRRGFAEVGERSQDVGGHLLELIECHRTL